MQAVRIVLREKKSRPIVRNGPMIYVVKWRDVSFPLGAFKDENIAHRYAATEVLSEAYLPSIIEIDTEQKECSARPQLGKRCYCRCHKVNDDKYLCGHCSPIVYDGKEQATKLRQLYQREQYVEVTQQWNDFWEAYSEYMSHEDNGEDMVIQVIPIHLE